MGSNVPVAEATMSEAMLPKRVQEALGQLVGAAKEGLLALSVEVGLGVLRELLVSYHVGPVSGVGDWGVSLVGRNLFTITGYRGFDPEVGIGGANGGQGSSAALNATDSFTFPNTRSFTLGITTSF